MKEEKIWYQLYEEALHLGPVQEYLYNVKAGGVNIFVGVTREWTGERQTKELSYECYETMALKEMKRLLEEACEKWPVVKACLHHRTGLVRPAEPSVIIGVATPHRKESFEACRFLIDDLKVRVPIWKKESYSDGTIEWVDPTGKTECQHGLDEDMAEAL